MRRSGSGFLMSTINILILLVSPLGVPWSNTSNELACPTDPNLDFASKSEFSGLSNSSRGRNSHIFARARNACPVGAKIASAELRIARGIYLRRAPLDAESRPARGRRRGEQI